MNADATASPYFVGSDLPPVLTGLGKINPFSIQSRLGNELLPQQPMTNLMAFSPFLLN